MSGMQCRFVLLKYASAMRSEAADPCLVVAHIYPQNREEHGVLHISRPDTWTEAISEVHRDYISQLIEDWEQTAPSDIPELFEQLGRLSIGPLRTAGGGECLPEQVEKIAVKFFQGSSG